MIIDNVLCSFVQKFENISNIIDNLFKTAFPLLKTIEMINKEVIKDNNLRSTITLYSP
jgi:hypothetical protein